MLGTAAASAFCEVVQKCLITRADTLVLTSATTFTAPLQRSAPHLYLQLTRIQAANHPPQHLTVAVHQPMACEELAAGQVFIVRVY